MASRVLAAAFATAACLLSCASAHSDPQLQPATMQASPSAPDVIMVPLSSPAPATTASPTTTAADETTAPPTTTAVDETTVPPTTTVADETTASPTTTAADATTAAPTTTTSPTTTAADATTAALTTTAAKTTTTTTTTAATGAAPKCLSQYDSCTSASDCCGVLSCARARWLGGRPVCLPTGPQCYPAFTRCEGAPGLPYVPPATGLAPCCDQKLDCAARPNLGAGKFCVWRTSEMAAKDAEAALAAAVAADAPTAAPAAGAAAV